MAHPVRVRTSTGWKDIAIPGPPGTQGPPGQNGSAGATGPAGANGATGAQGPPGNQGIQGVKGDTGTPGSQGPKGDTGNQGPQGIQGTQGNVGPQGAAGSGVTMKGSVATSGNLPPSGNTQGDAYIVQSDDSLWLWNGSTWISGGSIQGPPGATGATGSQGPTGATGNTGSQGPQGNPGTQGPQGIQGNTGNTGASGAPGALWRSGAGAPAGALGIVGDWYLNDSNGDVYEKTGASTYTLRDNLTGPQGIQGTQGPVGPSTGAAGGDLNGNYPNPTVAHLDNAPMLSSTTPGQPGPMLKGGEWGSPDGESSARKGSLWLDGSQPELLINIDGGSDWEPIVPNGGAAGQVLAKSGAGAFKTQWVTPSVAAPPEVHIGPSTPPSTQVLWLDTDESYPSARVTSLPATPYDGQEVNYVANAANGVLWRLVYNAASASAYKWEFIGGSPLSAEVLGSQTFSTIGAYTDIPGGGVSIALPKAGDYLIHYGGQIGHTGSGQGTFLSVVATGLTAGGNNNAILNQPNTVNSTYASVAKQQRSNGISGTLKLQYWVGIAGGVGQQMFLHVTPVRI